MGCAGQAARAIAAASLIGQRRQVGWSYRWRSRDPPPRCVEHVDAPPRYGLALPFCRRPRPRPRWPRRASAPDRHRPSRRRPAARDAASRAGGLAAWQTWACRRGRLSARLLAPARARSRLSARESRGVPRPLHSPGSAGAASVPARGFPRFSAWSRGVGEIAWRASARMRMMDGACGEGDGAETCRRRGGASDGHGHQGPAATRQARVRARDLGLRAQEASRGGLPARRRGRCSCGRIERLQRAAAAVLERFRGLVSAPQGTVSVSTPNVLTLAAAERRALGRALART